MSGFLKLRGRSKIVKNAKSEKGGSGHVSGIARTTGLDDTIAGMIIRNKMTGTDLIREEKIVTGSKWIVIGLIPGQTTDLQETIGLHQEMTDCLHERTDLIREAVIERTEIPETGIMIVLIVPLCHAMPLHRLLPLFRDEKCLPKSHLHLL
jgi:hypothetical protein